MITAIANGTCRQIGPNRFRSHSQRDRAGALTWDMPEVRSREQLKSLWVVTGDEEIARLGREWLGSRGQGWQVTGEITGRITFRLRSGRIGEDEHDEDVYSVEVDFVKTFQGFTAVDFGTTASVASVIDDKIRRAGVGLSPTQRYRMAETLEARVQDQTWIRYVEDVGRWLDIEADPDRALLAILRRGDAEAVAGLLAQFERRTQGSPSRRAALNELYDAACGRPPLDALSQHLVPLRQDGSTELSSEVAVDPDGRVLVGDELDVVLSSPNGAARLTRHRDLKSVLGAAANRRTIDGDEPRLIREYLQHVLRRTEDFVTAEPDLTSGAVRRLAATYPTVAGPARRQALRGLLVEAGLASPDDAVLHYDEATAAAMYYVMHETGAHFGVGFESLRSRCRELEPGRWRQNVLVVDMGGGTADIVLIQLDLDDRSDDFVAQILAADRGRVRAELGTAYRLTPEVLGSTGLLQHGGDAITLGLFRLAKAKIAEIAAGAATDAETVETLQAHAGDGLAIGTTSGWTSGSLWAQHVGRLDRYVPTTWAGAPDGELVDRTHLFWRLWQQAEGAKIALGATGETAYRIDLRQICDDPLFVDQSMFSSWPDDLELTIDDYEQAALPILTRIVAEAVGLAKEGLSTGRPTTRPLDQIVLTGRSSALTGLRDLLDARLGSSRPGSDVPWDSGRLLRFDGADAKHAAAVGACYALMLEERGYAAEGIETLLARGTSHLEVDVRNLRFSLPCDFLVAGQAAQGSDGGIPLFSARDRLHQIDYEYKGKKRSPALHAMADVSVHRGAYGDSNASIRWMGFNFRDHLGSARFDQHKADLRMRFEVDDELSMVAFIYRGGLLYDLRDSDRRHGAASRFAVQTADGDHQLIATGIDGPELATALHVDASAAGDVASAGERVALFEPGPLPDRFIVGDRIVHGRLATLRHPPNRSATWQVRDSEDRRRVTLNDPPLETDYDFERHVVVLEDGTFVTMKGDPPIAIATGVDGMLEGSGAYRIELEPEEQADAKRRHDDPFNGRQ